MIYLKFQVSGNKFWIECPETVLSDALNWGKGFAQAGTLIANKPVDLIDSRLSKHPTEAILPVEIIRQFFV